MSDAGTVNLVESVRAAFADAFGASPTAAARAPGRVELLGNHTDYNGGLVLAAAIDRDTVVVGRPIAGREGRTRSARFVATVAQPLDALSPRRDGGWAEYVAGVAWALRERFGPLASGYELAFDGAVPLGAGLSSSASLEAAVALFLLGAGLVPGQSADLDDAARLELAHALRRAENEYVGVGSGLLDQFSSLFGRAGHALYLDCRTLDHARVPMGDKPPTIVVCDTLTSRRLADGMYNRRVAECRTVVDYFRTLRGDEAVAQLRDLTPTDLAEHWDRLDPVGRLRARHVVTENERVRQGVLALRAGDVAAFGRLMSASHASSRDDFGNSSEALDALIEAAEAAPGFLGGKLSGAGWAGCTVSLVAADQAGAFAESVRAAHARRTGTTPEVHVCRAADGAATIAV